ncbi:MAG: hypothetical protein R2681_04895 [Pyrinomonadaceae bacterium]
MSDYKKQFEKWQREAKEKFDEIDGQLGLSEKLDEGVKVAKETAKKGAESVKAGVGKIRTEAEKTSVGKKAVEVADDAYETAEDVYETVEDTAKKTAKKAWEAGGTVREVAEDASENAGDVFETAATSAEDVLKTAGKKAGEFFGVASEKAGDVFGQTRRSVEATANSVTKALGLGASWTRTVNATVNTLRQTSDWVTEKPLQAAATGASVAVGAGLGVVFTGLSSHWLFNSALPAWSVQKASRLFTEHIKDQENLILKGNLSKAEAERVQFERKIARYVGAPLLGAFSFASGAVMMTNIFNPKTITGAPLSWLIGGNPMLEGVWFFGNGMVCFKTSYDFFMISLEDHEDVQKIVKEVKGMLPRQAEV